MGVDRETDTALASPSRDALHARSHVILKPVLRHGGERLGGESNIADVLDLEQRVDEGLQARPRHVGDIATRDDHIAYAGRAAKVVEHLGQSCVGLGEELQLLDLGRGVSDEVHARAVTAVLRTCRQELGQHLGRVAVRESFDRPHLVLVQGVARRVGVARPVGAPVSEHREHVATDGVGVERLRERTSACGVGVACHRVEHLRGHEHRHRGRALDVSLEVGVEPVVDEVAEHGMQLRDVLHAVRALPLRRPPVVGRDVGPAGEAGPVGLLERLIAVGVRLGECAAVRGLDGGLEGLGHVCLRCESIAPTFGVIQERIRDILRIWHH